MSTEKGVFKKYQGYRYLCSQRPEGMTWTASSYLVR